MLHLKKHDVRTKESIGKNRHYYDSLLYTHELIADAEVYMCSYNNDNSSNNKSNASQGFQLVDVIATICAFLE